MREIQEQKDKEAQAEIQNFMASTEAHCKEYNLKSYMLTLTLSSEELKESSSYISLYEHSKLAHNQVSLLRYFMKIIYSDRLVKYHLNNFFWLRMLEFTKIGNAHLHEALYLEEKSLISVIKLIGRKLIVYQKIGRTHLTVNEISWKKIQKDLHYKKISKNEYLLLDYSSSNFFNKGKDGAGQGFIIRVLTKRKNEQANKRSAVSRYIMKYLLKTRKNDKTKASIQRAVFSFLKINPFSFKRNVLFSLTKFRNIKNILIESHLQIQTSKTANISS